MMSKIKLSSIQVAIMQCFKCRWMMLLALLMVAGVYFFARNYKKNNAMQVVVAAARDTDAQRSTLRDNITAGLTNVNQAQHEVAQALAADLIKKNKPLSSYEAGVLLDFLRLSKPSNLNDEAWEERVNAVLNLLRNAEADFIPHGLNEVLLDMAANNPSKVLRLYAMQHLSLWFPREADQEKRKQMVDLLENIAANQHDETAGCAVLMLADMRREEIGIGTLDVPKDVNGIDWKRVDQVIADASQQLVGEKAARVDVRISAIHTCVDRKDGTALPAMRQIAEDVKLVSPLRKAAIYAIGQLGNSEDLTLLASLPQDDGNLSLAVLPAQKELELKFAQESLR